MENGMNYISILIESLKKKVSILDQILELNQLQLEAVSIDNGIDEEKFNLSLEKKNDCINEIQEIDKGFASVYNRVKNEISENKQTYTVEIQQLKDLISIITEKSMEIQLSEKKNEQSVLKKFSEEKQKIHQTKNANKVAANYYNNMNKVNYVEPQFMDKKK